MKRLFFLQLKPKQCLWHPQQKQYYSYPSYASNPSFKKVFYPYATLKPNYFPGRSYVRRHIVSSNLHLSEHQNSSTDISQIKILLASINSAKDPDQLQSVFENCNLNSLVDDDILQLYRKVSHLYNEFNNTDSLLAIIERIDKECISRASSWNAAQFVNFLKTYGSHSLKNSKFMFYALNRRLPGVFRESLPTILDYIRVLNDTNMWEKYKGRKYHLEDVFKSNFDKLSLQEIELILHPLVKLNVCIISDKLKKKLCIKLIEEFDGVTNSIMKQFFQIFCHQALFARNSLFITPWLLRIFRKLLDSVNDFDFECLNHAALLCTRMFIYDARILEYMATKLLENFSAMNLEEIEKALYALTYFGFHLKSKNLYIELIELLRREPLSSELSKNPPLLLNLLYHFSNIGIYPYDLLDTLFSEDILKKLYGPKLKANRISYEMHALVGGLTLECEDYKNNLIDKKLFDSNSKNRLRELPQELKNHPFIENVDSESMNTCLNASRQISPYNRVLYCTRGILDDMFGSTKYTHVCYLLSHFKKANILFCLNDKKNPQEIPESIRRKVIVNRSMLKSNLNWYVVSFVSQNEYTGNPPLPMGHEISKIRQLEGLGYHVITITRHGWLKLSIEEKKKVVKKKIFADSENSLEMFEKFN